MPVTLNQYYQKLVVTFTSIKSISEIQNMMDNDILPQTDNEIQNQFGTDIAGRAIEHGSEVTDQRNNTYEIYPKFLVSGTFNGNQAGFNARFDALVNQLKIRYGNIISAFGGTIIPNGFHVHRSDGSSSDEN